MVKASPGTQVSDTPLQLGDSLSFLFFQSPDAADDMQFIDDGSSNPGECSSLSAGVRTEVRAFVKGISVGNV